MTFENIVLNAVKTVTDVPAYFHDGSLFLVTTDSKIATKVFVALYGNVTNGVDFGRSGFETSYNFF